MTPNSQYFQALTELLRLIESLGIPSDQYDVADNAETLELSEALHAQIQDTQEFRALQSLGCNYSCYDKNDFDFDFDLEELL